MTPPSTGAGGCKPLHYFHGTKAVLGRGDVLRPRREHGGSPTTAPVTAGAARLPESDEWVYVTTDYYVAWAYAYASGGLGDEKVLVVEPQGSVAPDPEQSDHMNCFRCPSAEVLVIMDLPAPFSKQVARAGWKVAGDDPGESVKLFARRRD